MRRNKIISIVEKNLNSIYSGKKFSIVKEIDDNIIKFNIHKDKIHIATVQSVNHFSAWNNSTTWNFQNIKGESVTFIFGEMQDNNTIDIMVGNGKESKVYNYNMNLLYEILGYEFGVLPKSMFS